MRCKMAVKQEISGWVGGVLFNSLSRLNNESQIRLDGYVICFQLGGPSSTIRFSPTRYCTVYFLSCYFVLSSLQPGAIETVPPFYLAQFRLEPLYEARNNKILLLYSQVNFYNALLSRQIQFRICCLPARPVEHCVALCPGTDRSVSCCPPARYSCLLCWHSVALLPGTVMRVRPSGFKKSDRFLLSSCLVPIYVITNHVSAGLF